LIKKIKCRSTSADECEHNLTIVIGLVDLSMSHFELDKAGENIRKLKMSYIVIANWCYLTLHEETFDIDEFRTRVTTHSFYGDFT
jgi:hypothetical protein